MNSHKQSVLVTGATGYIASHTILELLEAGYEVIGIDNLASSKKSVISRIIRLSNRSMIFRQLDIRDHASLKDLFITHDIQSVIHFAGYKAVGESVENPMLYYSNNLRGSITLLEVMKEMNVKNLVFSSSCTVYGDEGINPVTENHNLNPTNPYGRTKYMTEQILNDLSASDSDWHIVSLRYFNPIGAHSSGEMGEDPLGIPNNLLPYIAQTALGKREKLNVFGGNYPTKDGTCMRDYIHVSDLAKGHIDALEQLNNFKYEAINLGTGTGYTVLEVIKAFEDVSGQKVNFEIVEPRSGDAAAVWADPKKAKEKLNWEAKKSLADMCHDAWKFQVNNPQGYQPEDNAISLSDLKYYSSKSIESSANKRRYIIKTA